MEGPDEASVPRQHALERSVSVVQAPFEVGADVHRREARDRCRPARADAFSAVDEAERYDGGVVVRLNLLAFLSQVVKEQVVVFVEDHPSQLVDVGVDVTWTGCLLAAHHAGTELTDRHQEIQVVASDEVLRHHYYGLAQADLTVVVGRVLSHVARKLGHFNLTAEVALEACEEDLPLAWLQTVNK